MSRKQQQTTTVDEYLKRPDYWALAFCNAVRDGREQDADNAAQQFTELVSGWRLVRA